MKTTEIFAEQIIIGFLILGIIVLPFLTCIKWNQSKMNLENIGKGILIITLAYLLGIIFDRFADTLLSRHEQYNRLNFAKDLKEKLHEKQFTQKDPFPEEIWRMKILSRKDGTTDFMEYLRSRIRLSRSLAVFLPALTISGLLKIGLDTNSDYFLNLTRITLGFIAIVYTFAFLIVIWISNSKKGSKFVNWKLPKTWDSDFESKKKNFKWGREPMTIALIIFSLIGILLIILIRIKVPKSILTTIPILVIGSGLSALSAWSWWRITGTFMQLLNNCQKAGLIKEKQSTGQNSCV